MVLLFHLFTMSKQNSIASKFDGGFLQNLNNKIGSAPPPLGRKPTKETLVVNENAKEDELEKEANVVDTPEIDASTESPRKPELDDDNNDEVTETDPAILEHLVSSRHKGPLRRKPTFVRALSVKYNNVPVDGDSIEDQQDIDQDSPVEEVEPSIDENKEEGSQAPTMDDEVSDNVTEDDKPSDNNVEDKTSDIIVQNEDPVSIPENKDILTVPVDDEPSKEPESLPEETQSHSDTETTSVITEPDNNNDEQVPNTNSPDLEETHEKTKEIEPKIEEVPVEPKPAPQQAQPEPPKEESGWSCNIL